MQCIIDKWRLEAKIKLACDKTTPAKKQLCVQLLQAGHSVVINGTLLVVTTGAYFVTPQNLNGEYVFGSNWLGYQTYAAESSSLEDLNLAVTWANDQLANPDGWVKGMPKTPQEHDQDVEAFNLNIDELIKDSEGARQARREEYLLTVEYEYPEVEAFSRWH